MPKQPMQTRARSLQKADSSFGWTPLVVLLFIVGMALGQLVGYETQAGGSFAVTFIVVLVGGLFSALFIGTSSVPPFTVTLRQGLIDTCRLVGLLAAVAMLQLFLTIAFDEPTDWSSWLNAWLTVALLIPVLGHVVVWLGLTIVAATGWIGMMAIAIVCVTATGWIWQVIKSSITHDVATAFWMAFVTIGIVLVPGLFVVLVLRAERGTSGSIYDRLRALMHGSSSRWWPGVWGLRRLFYGFDFWVLLTVWGSWTVLWGSSATNQAISQTNSMAQGINSLMMLIFIPTLYLILTPMIARAFKYRLWSHLSGLWAKALLGVVLVYLVGRWLWGFIQVLPIYMVGETTGLEGLFLAAAFPLNWDPHSRFEWGLAVPSIGWMLWTAALAIFLVERYLRMAFLPTDEKEWTFRQWVSTFPVIPVVLVVVFAASATLHWFKKADAASPRMDAPTWKLTAEPVRWADALLQCEQIGSGWRLPTMTEVALYREANWETWKNPDGVWTSQWSQQGPISLVWSAVGTVWESDNARRILPAAPRDPFQQFVRDRYSTAYVTYTRRDGYHFQDDRHLNQKHSALCLQPRQEAGGDDWTRSVIHVETRLEDGRPISETLPNTAAALPSLQARCKAGHTNDGYYVRRMCESAVFFLLKQSNTDEAVALAEWGCANGISPDLCQTRAEFAAKRAEPTVKGWGLIHEDPAPYAGAMLETLMAPFADAPPLSGETIAEKRMECENAVIQEHGRMMVVCKVSMFELIYDGNFKEAWWFAEKSCARSTPGSCTALIAMKDREREYGEVIEALRAKGFLSAAPSGHRALFPIIKRACREGLALSCWYEVELAAFTKHGYAHTEYISYDRKELAYLYDVVCRKGIPRACTQAVEMLTDVGCCVDKPLMSSQEMFRRYREICRVHEEAKACAVDVMILAKQFEQKGGPASDRQTVRTALEGSCGKEVRTKQAYRQSCQEIKRLEDIGLL